VTTVDCRCGETVTVISITKLTTLATMVDVPWREKKHENISEGHSSKFPYNTRVGGAGPNGVGQFKGDMCRPIVK